jgi:hypothetical protein
LDRCHQDHVPEVIVLPIIEGCYDDVDNTGLGSLEGCQGPGLLGFDQVIVHAADLGGLGMGMDLAVDQED